MGNRKAVTQKFLVYLAPEQSGNWIQVCALVLFEPFGHRQGRRGKALTVSIDRVGGSIRIGGGADRGVAPVAVVGLGGPTTRPLVVTRAQLLS